MIYKLPGLVTRWRQRLDQSILQQAGALGLDTSRGWAKQPWVVARQRGWLVNMGRVQRLDSLHQIMVKAVNKAHTELPKSPQVPHLTDLMRCLQRHLPPSCLLAGPQALQSVAEVSVACAWRLFTAE